MRCVVVGGLGFLGAAVVRELLRRGQVVVVVDPNHSQADADARFGMGRAKLVRGDILHPHSLRQAFVGADEVYHFAGVLGTSELDDDIHRAIAGNIVGAANVFEAAAGASVSTVLYPSKPNVWLNAYTVTKAASEQLARLYAATRDLNVRSLRYFNAYGPEQATGPIRKIIPTFVLQALRGEPLTVYGDGKQTVDMIYSDDIGTVTVDFARSAADAEPVDCGRGIAMTVNDVAADVNAILGNRAGTIHLPMRRGETPNTTLVADPRRLTALIGDHRFANWQDSLRTTVEWYAERYPDGVAGSLTECA
jgi:UDP-glucose 4-epimerase